MNRFDCVSSTNVLFTGIRVMSTVNVHFFGYILRKTTSKGETGNQTIENQASWCGAFSVMQWMVTSQK